MEFRLFSSVFCCSVVSNLQDPMDHSMWGLPVHHRLLESAQTHLHWVGDAIQPSPPLASPSPPAFNLSQHQGFFLVSRLWASGGQSTGAWASASVLSVNIQGWFPLQLTGLISLVPLVAQMVKYLPAMQETLVRSMGQDDPLEKGMAIHSSILA